MFYYHLRTALSNIARNAGINMLTVFSISVGLFLIVMTTTTVITLRSAVRQWTAGYGITVYLKDNITNELSTAAQSLIRAEAGVRSIQHIAKAEALNELKRMLGEATLAGLEENPLPDTLKVSVDTHTIENSGVPALAARLSAIPGVESVDYGQKWVDTIADMARRGILLGTALGLSLTVGIVFILSNTIKILFYRRAGEIEILKLLGATPWFIRAPFIVEGVLFGLLAGIFASVGSNMALRWLSSGMGLSFAQAVSSQLLVWGMIFFGGFLGVIGSILSIGRIRL